MWLSVSGQRGWLWRDISSTGSSSRTPPSLISRAKRRASESPFNRLTSKVLNTFSLLWCIPHQYFTQLSKNVMYKLVPDEVEVKLFFIPLCVTSLFRNDHILQYNVMLTITHVLLLSLLPSSVCEKLNITGNPRSSTMNYLRGLLKKKNRFLALRENEVWKKESVESTSLLWMTT